jgi:hypothetical protein
MKTSDDKTFSGTTVYMVSEPGTNAKAIERSLSSFDVRVVDRYSHDSGSPITSPARAIQNSDAVVTVIDSLSKNLMFEAGIAFGLGKPMATVAIGDIELPFLLNASVHIRTRDASDPMLAKSLKHFVDNLRKSSAGSGESARAAAYPAIHHEPIDFSKEITRLRQLRTESNPLEVEQIVLRILERVSIVASARLSIGARKDDQGVDAIVWSDSLGQTIGSQIIVEIKTFRAPNPSLAAISRQLEFYIESTQSSLALLIYLASDESRLTSAMAATPRVIPIDAEDFAKSLESQSFEEVVLAARNAWVHGR